MMFIVFFAITQQQLNAHSSNSPNSWIFSWERRRGITSSMDAGLHPCKNVVFGEISFWQMILGKSLPFWIGKNHRVKWVYQIYQGIVSHPVLWLCAGSLWQHEVWPHAVSAIHATILVWMVWICGSWCHIPKRPCYRAVYQKWNKTSTQSGFIHFLASRKSINYHKFRVAQGCCPSIPQSLVPIYTASMVMDEWTPICRRTCIKLVTQQDTGYHSASCLA